MSRLFLKGGTLMTITSSGPMCDVCGDYILPLDPEERVNTFNIGGIRETLTCHNKCKAVLVAAGTDWKLLPEKGSIYKAFAKAQD